MDPADWTEFRALGHRIMDHIQEAGVAAPCITSINGKLPIRAAIVNHRTRAADVDAIVDAVLPAAAARMAGQA